MAKSSIKYKLTERSEFLSGPVRSKLKTLEKAAIIDPTFERSMLALRAHQPEDVPITQIDINPGALWIPNREYLAFLQEVLGVRCAITRADSTNFWNIEPWYGVESLENQQTYGLSWKHWTASETNPEEKTKKLTGLDLFALSLNSKVPEIRRRAVECEDIRKDPVLTANACEKQRQLRERFVEWCKESPERAARLERIYNDNCNNIRLRQYDGSHLSLSRMSSYWAERIKQRPYQLNCIYRGVTGQVLEDELASLGVFLAVGYGKTATGSAIAFERKANQTCTKAMIIVQKSTLRDFASTIRQMYPQAKCLVATPDDLSLKKRQMFLARVAFGDWDIVIVTHDSFAKIPLRSATLEAHIQRQIDKCSEEMKALGYDQNNKAVKSLERKRNKLHERMEKLADRHDVGICFEDLSVDLLIADEADVYKNLPFFTKMGRVAGIPSSSSDRAEDFYVKQWWMTDRYGQGRVVKMTGTFISNSLVELWKELMDLCPNQMKLRGWHQFDAWAACCGMTKTGAAIKNTGTIARETRFSEFINLAEQLLLLFSVAEVRDSDAPEVESCKPKPKYVNIAVPMSQMQREYMDYLVERSQLVKLRDPMKWPKIDKKTGEQVVDEDGPKFIVDNNLFITTDGRKAVLDFRLIDPEAPDNPKSKINVCVRRVFNIWKRTQQQRSTQVIFCDMGVPNPNADFVPYHHIRDELIAMGVPAQELAIAQEYKSDTAKEELHQAVRDGKVRVVIGSTEILGVGVNIQDRLIALHHLDVRWRPRDMTQREGRILRPGNLNKRVLIYRYITQGIDGNVGFDSFMWDKIKYKTKFIRQLFRGDLSIRRMEEDASEDPTFSASEIVALATGDTRIMTYVELEANVNLKKTLLASYQQDIDRLMHTYGGSRDTSIEWIESQIEWTQTKLGRIQPDVERVIEHRESCTGEQFWIEIQGEKYTSGKEAAKALNEIVDYVESVLKGKYEENVGRFGGFDFDLKIVPAGNFLVLKSPDTGEWYDIRLLRNIYDAEERITRNYLEIADQMDGSRKYLDKLQTNLAKAKQELDRKQKLVANLKVELAQLEADKLALEQELGLGQSNGEIEAIEFDEEGED